MLTVQEIQSLMEEDISSEKKRLAKTGDRYYNGEHDILNYQIYYYDADGKLQLDKFKSNIRISHPFFTELVDQQVQYMLSGGGQQCTAIARALITKPSIILADEPTGSFDAKTSQNVAGLLKMTAETFHQTLILITHNQELAQLADRVVRLRDGRIVEEQ